MFRAAIDLTDLIHYFSCFSMDCLLFIFVFLRDLITKELVNVIKKQVVYQKRNKNIFYENSFFKTIIGTGLLCTNLQPQFLTEIANTTCTTHDCRKWSEESASLTQILKS